MSVSPARAPGNGPLVSVVLPAYNGGRTILQTLQSLSTQDYPDSEWIIVDDGSRDDLAAVINSFLGSGRQRTRVIRHPENQGLSRSLNEGVRAAAGDLVLVVHQDIELVGTNWLSRAVSYLHSDPDIQVVTGYYGIPAAGELTFAERAFGFMRRQFHPRPGGDREFVPFSEFKCDLIRKSTLESLGGFPVEYRRAGEDIAVSYRIRLRGGRILKAYDLQAIQRFSGKGETIVGNLEKEFRFGRSIGGVLKAFGRFPFRDLRMSSNARSRSLHRASQPAVAFATLVSALLFLIRGWVDAGLLLVFLLVARYAYYAVRLWPDFRRSVGRIPQAIGETALASVLGLVTDFVYPAGVAVGLIRSAYGATV